MAVCTILWGIWFWRNKKVCEENVVSAEMAMQCSFSNIEEWRKAQERTITGGKMVKAKKCKAVKRWKRSDCGVFKCNVDACFFSRSLILFYRNGCSRLQGSFCERKSSIFISTSVCAGGRVFRSSRGVIMASFKGG